MVYSNRGSVYDGITGLLFEPEDTSDLASKLRQLWERPDLCRRLGEAGRAKALREYSPERYYERLVLAYQRAIEPNEGRRTAS